MRIKEALKENGSTQQMLADKMNVSLSAVKQMVAAELLMTSTLEKIASALNAPMWQLPHQKKYNFPQMSPLSTRISH